MPVGEGLPIFVSECTQIKFSRDKSDRKSVKGVFLCFS